MNDVQCRAIFRKKLNGLLDRSSMKRVTLAKLAGVSVSQVNRWSDGDLMPTWHQFQRLMDIFGVEDEQLLGTSISESSYNKRFKPGSRCF